MSRVWRYSLAGCVLVLALLAGHVRAQSLPYGDFGDSDAPSGGDPARAWGRGGHSLGNASGGARTKIQPYIELSQSVLVRLQPDSEVLTYSSVAAGVDVSLAGRRTEGAVSVRYERRFAESGNIASNDTISGLARVRHDLVPRQLTIEAGGLATRTRFDSSGASRLGPVGTSTDWLSSM